MINSARATAAYFDLDSGSRALLCLPLGFIAGRMMLVRSMVMGWELDVISSTSTPKIPRQNHYDFCAMVPLQLYNFLNVYKPEINEYNFCNTQIKYHHLFIFFIALNILSSYGCVPIGLLCPTHVIILLFMDFVVYVFVTSDIYLFISCS